MGALVFDTTWRKTLLVAAFLAVWALPLPGLARQDPFLGAPDQYRANSELMSAQALLSAKGFYRGPVDGMTSEGLDDAILAFHKAADLERTTDLLPYDLARLAAWEPQVPDVPDQPNRLEVDLDRQVMHLVEGGEVVATLHVSTGGGFVYLSPTAGVGWARAVTPLGSFQIERNIAGWRYVNGWGLYRPWYFDGPYALHGSLDVPIYPASHGCVRLTLSDADWVSERLSIGFHINVRETIPRMTPASTVAARPFGDPLGMYS